MRASTSVDVQPAPGPWCGHRGQWTEFPEAVSAGFDTVCGLKMNVKTQPWAFTFLCQFGFCRLTLMLTWGGDRVCSLWGSYAVLTQQNWSGKRLSTLSEAIDHV